VDFVQKKVNPKIYVLRTTSTNFLIRLSSFLKIKF